MWKGPCRRSDYGDLGQSLQDHARAAGNAAGHGAGVIQAFGKRVTGLKAQAHSRGTLADAGLQRVIAGMRTGGHDRLGAEATDSMACRVELGKGRKGRVRASVAVRREDTGEMNSRGANVGGAQFDASDFMVHAEGVRADISISEMWIEADGRE